MKREAYGDDNEIRHWNEVEYVNAIFSLYERKLEKIKEEKDKMKTWKREREKQKIKNGLRKALQTNHVIYATLSDVISFFFLTYCKNIVHMKTVNLKMHICI